MNSTLLHRSIEVEPTTASNDLFCGLPRPLTHTNDLFPETIEDCAGKPGIFGYQVAHSEPVSHNSRPASQQSGAQDALPRFHLPGDIKSSIVSSSGSSPDSSKSHSSIFSFASLHSGDVSGSDSVESDFSRTSPTHQFYGSVPVTGRMADYRFSRGSQLQPPVMPHHIQSPGSMLPSSASLLNRDNGYSSLPYSMSRNFSVPQTTNTFTDTSRYHQYETRSNDVTMTNTPTAVYGSSNGLYLESPSRLPPPNADSPPWLETETYHRITGNGQSVKPEIQARIHKGFFPAGGYWTCYRRNYFSVSLSFAMKPWLGYVSYLLHRPGRAPEKILSFAMRLSASVNGQEKETRELIQHTPKRDKQSESKPKQATLQPQPPPSLLINHSNNPSINFATPPSQSAGMQMDYSSSYGGAQQSSQTPTFHTWERIQFQKATANNGKRRAQQQFYNLAAELWAEIADPHGNGAEWILLAKRLSNPVVVRGRSPGHYKDAKRDSASRNGDTDPGASVLSRPGIHNGINMTHSRSQIPSVYDPIPRNNSQYDYRRMPSTDQSPLTASSLVSSSSSSPGYDSMLNDSLNPMQPITHTSSIDGYGQPAYASASAPRRVAVEPMSTRCVLPSFGDTTKAHDHNDMSLGEAFDPMIPMMNSDHGGPGHYLRAQPNGYVNHEVSRPPSGGRFNSYSTRPEDHTYGRYDTMPNSHIM